MKNNLLARIEHIQNEIQFSGTVLVRDKKETYADASYGYANRAEQLKNEAGTRFGIASGCKLFTAIAICQLVGEGKISFDTKVTKYLPFDFLHFDEHITVHHLLTHTSGVPDYFDEEVMDDFEELWIKNPMYHLRRLEDFLPLFQNEQMKFKPGERFHYNNAGFILLGLIVEKASGLVFKEYIQQKVFAKADMTDSGYFALDSLPGKTAIGYIDTEDGTWKTNAYSIPVQGGSDGGAFVTANDMAKLWDALVNYQLVNKTLTDQLLTAHAKEEDGDYYGYGVWIEMHDDSVVKYHVMGYDPGVSFHSAYYPATDIRLVVCSNESAGAFNVMHGIEEELKLTETI
ncbi:beta-lactamase family protein [Sporosarcina sp. ACRSL]|uniref:serine hydrolase domain-containing protein n=1 Tax=Sporosarcina sp. ACRSL TaxID=2918215 RepID=UPI001EF464D8|nr:serine hydrolase [Sporosarcina sp. ACRSL]MCG7342639.1 beta-lactamase family protein [Sporosarcina sp. ACRSL]